MSWGQEGRHDGQKAPVCGASAPTLTCEQGKGEKPGSERPRPRGAAPSTLQHSPSADDEAQGVQVAVVGSPEGRGHAILIWRVEVLLGGFLQEVQVAVPGCSVVLVVHGAERSLGERMGARGAHGVGMGTGRCQEGPARPAQLRRARTPEKSWRGGSSSFQPRSAVLPLGPKRPPELAAPHGEPFTRQLRSTLKAPIKQHRRARLSRTLWARGHSVIACKDEISPLSGAA